MKIGRTDIEDFFIGLIFVSICGSIIYAIFEYKNHLWLTFKFVFLAVASIAALFFVFIVVSTIGTVIRDTWENFRK